MNRMYTLPMIAEVLSNPSQLVLRNSQALHCQRLLMIGMPADDLAEHLLADQVTTEVHALTRDFAVYRSLAADWEAGNDQRFLKFGTVSEDTPRPLFDGVLVFLQKSKPLMDFWLDMLESILSPEGKLWLVGENGEGIKSWRKRLKRHFSDVVSLDSARHCGLLEATGMSAPETAFDVQRYYQHFEVETGESTIKVSSLPGVFSHGRLDKGTEVLLGTLADLDNKKRILDFGCGAGVISAAVSTKMPGAHMTLVDCDAFALQSSEHTLKNNGCCHYQVLASDGLSEVSGTFDLILSNPPFHQGVKTHYEVTEQFLAQSRQHLIPGGELRIVANSFLRYEPIIKQTFGHCETVATANGFTVYRARR